MTDSPSDPSPAGGPPPGWYPDPYGQPGYRWWNGVAWTEDRSTGDDANRGRLLSVGDMLGETFRVLGQRIGHLFTLAAVLLLAPSVLASFAVYSMLDGVLYEDGEWSGIDGGTISMLLVAAFVAVIAQLVFIAAVNRQGMAALQGAPEPWSASLVGGLRRAPRVLGANLVVWVGATVGTMAVVIVAAVISPVLFALVGVAVLAGLVVVWVRAGFLSTAAAVAPSGVGAIRTSFGVSRGHVWGLFGRFLLLVVLFAAVNSGGSIATAPVSGVIEDPADDALVVDEDSGEVLRFEIGEFFPGNLGVLGFTLVVTTLIQATGSTVSALARLSLYRSLAGPVDEALTTGPTGADTASGSWP